MCMVTRDTGFMSLTLSFLVAIGLFNIVLPSFC